MDGADWPGPGQRPRPASGAAMDDHPFGIKHPWLALTPISPISQTAKAGAAPTFAVTRETHYNQPLNIFLTIVGANRSHTHKAIEPVLKNTGWIWEPLDTVTPAAQCDRV